MVVLVVTNYYFAEPFKTFSSLSVAMLTLSFVIVSLVVPYLKSLMSKVVLEKLRLEKTKKKLPVEKIVEKYNMTENEIGNINTIFLVMFINIAIFFLILFFNTFVLVNGEYVQISADNKSLVWAIKSDYKIMSLSVQQIYNTSLYGSFFGFLILVGITIYIYTIIKKTIIESVKEQEKRKNDAF